MQGYVGPIDALTEGNRNFRRVLFTGGHMQLVLMTLKPGEEIGSEVHATHDQFFRIQKGRGEIRIGGERSSVKSGDVIIVPAGTRHNLINTGQRRLRLYTLYAPPQHADRLVEANKANADKHEAARTLAASAEHGRKDMIDEGSPVVTPVKGTGG
jgi:mannose-6-phosphate isomerase-like protein (cupin superfamily)